jgi:stage II sporulation protein AA (anti-sigma F factor antagonist)
MGPGIQSRPIDDSRHELVLRGRLHANAVEDLRTALDDAASRARVLVLDASDLESVDAIALQAIVDVVKRLRPCGGAVVMFGVRPTVQRLLELTTVDRLVTVRDSRDDALGVAA